ncbi:hypothetical protein YC2023_114260 [Brassica napus]
MKEMTEDISTFVTKLRKVPHTDYYERRIKRFSDQWKCIKQTCLDIPTYISINYILAFYFFSERQEVVTEKVVCNKLKFITIIKLSNASKILRMKLAHQLSRYLKYSFPSLKMGRTFKLVDDHLCPWFLAWQVHGRFHVDELEIYSHLCGCLWYR